jgi:hypothetical protein
VDLVRHRFEDRHANILGNLNNLSDWHLRFTVRIFGDCIDEEKRKELLGNYSEYWIESELREFARTFLPAYSEYAIAELVEKKKGGERFDPPWITQEEYQEMAVREKWPRIASHLEHVTPLQLRREIARAGMLFRPYMLSDPGFNEGVLEFALYFDLLDRLAKLSPEELRATGVEIAALVDRAVAEGTPRECEPILRQIRERAARAAGVPVDPENLLGPEMERYPREAPPGWKLRELRSTLSTMTQKDLRLSALVHLDLLTTEETREIVSPFIARFPAFYEIPPKGLQEIILARGEDHRPGDHLFHRSLLGGANGDDPAGFLSGVEVDAGRGKTAPPQGRQREDGRGDDVPAPRAVSPFLLTGELSDAGKQISLLTDRSFSSNHGLILRAAGGEPTAGASDAFMTR